MSRRAKREDKVNNKVISKLIIVAVFLGLIFWVLNITPNYINDTITNKINLVINNNNVTKSLKKDILIENSVIYIAKEDIANFFDPYIYYDEKYNQIITTSEAKVASMTIGENMLIDNGSKMEVDGTILKKNDTYYIPFSSFNDIYNVEINYIESSNTITVDSKDRKYVVADSTKDNKVKAYPTTFSRTVDEIENGETVTIVQNKEDKNLEIDGWTEVRTDTGELGYVKSNTLANEYMYRKTLEKEKQIEKKVSMVWDYVYEYDYVPDRSGTTIKGVNVVSPTLFTLVNEGKGQIYENVGEDGKKYIEWAHSNGYKVWPSISNNSYIETTSEIMQDYHLRHELIENIVALVVKYNLDGINIDFEYMHAEDKDLFSRFIIELEPRLNEIGAVLSVDVTAPDGSEEWSMCYDRHIIGEIADYIVFMAYDQYGESSNTAGTTAGYDWTKVNIQKFLGQEGVEPEKIILGVPFFTRVWEEQNGKLVSKTPIAMNKIEDFLPEGASKTWDEDLKQYYVEFVKDGITYKIWVEDEESLKAKLSLIKEYNLIGAAYWVKDMETETIWNLISEELGV